MEYTKGICSSCNKEQYIYHKKKCQCQYCWKKERSISWSKNSKPKKPTKIKITKKAQDTIKKDQEFYKEIWEERPHHCQECGIYLGMALKKEYISHILSKGAFPKLRYDKKNINVLCFNHHQQWEFGKRNEMKISTKNETIISELKYKYSRLISPFFFAISIGMYVAIFFS